MTDAGGINTCFLTTRLPLWAGVRQNVTGSNINGTPVTSGVFNQATPRAASETERAEPAATARARVAAVTMATARAVDEEAVVLEEVQRLKQTLTEVETKVAQLSASMTGLQTSLEALRATAPPTEQTQTQ